MSDCKPAMEAMEAAWREGTAHGMRKDRGALLEAICSLRASLGRVVTMWTPSHVGISPNAYADCAAKTHTRATVSDLTGDLAAHIRSRPVIYERCVRREGESQPTWEMADRRPFAEGRRRARAYVRGRLGETVGAGRTSAGVTGRLWSAVVKCTDRKARPDGAAKRNRTAIEPEDVEAYNARRGVALGLRVGQVCGVQGGRMHDKRLRAEGTGGGPASTSEAFGCLACKVARDRQRRESAAAPRRGDWKKRARDEWIAERDEAARCRPTLQHLLDGACEATGPLWRSTKHDAHVQQLKRAYDACKSARDDSTTGAGERSTAVLAGAVKAARTIQRGEQAGELDDANRFAVLAGCLPAWAADGETHEKEPTREVTDAVMTGQALATEAVTEWREQTAPARHFLRNRSESRGLLQLVLRAWRERVEHEAPGISCDSSRWRVREEQTGGRRTTRVTARRRPRPAPSEEKRFADAKLEQIEQVAASFTWNPWRVGDARTQHETGQEETEQDDEAQLRRWRLRGDMLRVATYYRVTGARHRAECRTRRARVKARFQRWAMTVLSDRRQQDQGATGKRRAEGEPSYREARPYKQRATPEEMQRRRLGASRTRRTNTAQSTEIGKRLRENMEVIGQRCKAARGDG